MFNEENFKFGVCDVDAAYKFYFQWLLGKLHKIFKWKNLPETIDETYLNDQLFLNGFVCFTTNLDGKLRVFTGGLGGEPNVYYKPTVFTVSNPVVGSDTLENDKDCVMMFNTKNDAVYNYLPFTHGLFGLLHQTATLLADNVVSINTAQINTRVQAVVTSTDPTIRESAEVHLKKLYQGKPWTVASESLISEIKVNPMANSSSSAYIAQLIELHQYIIADFFNAVGIKTNPVNKKERLITGEIDSVDDFLAINLTEMLDSRNSALEKINAKYNTNIQVELCDELKPVVEKAVNELDYDEQSINNDRKDDDNVQ